MDKSIRDNYGRGINTNRGQFCSSKLLTLIWREGSELYLDSKNVANTSVNRPCPPGARALKSIVETTLLDAMFEIPGSDIQHVLITSDTVLEKQEPQYTRREGDVVVEQ